MTDKNQLGFAHAVLATAIAMVLGVAGAFMIVRGQAASCTANDYQRDTAVLQNDSDCVAYLQRLANYYTEGTTVAQLEISGEYTAQTEAAIRAVQQRFHLTVDGQTGSKTWKALCTPPQIYDPDFPYESAARPAGCPDVPTKPS